MVLKPSNVTVFSHVKRHPAHSKSVYDAIKAGYLVVTLDNVPQENVLAFDVRNGFVKTYVPTHVLQEMINRKVDPHKLKRLTWDGMRSKGEVRVYHV